jgi:hypothetical protein
VEEELEKKKILKKYRINLDKKKELMEMSEMERNERRYGIIVGKGTDYLNPVLSQRYIERTFFKF